MQQFLRILFDNPILILILVGWLFSALAGAASKAAKRQAQPRRRPEFDAVREKQRQADQARAPSGESRPRTPDDIARELREMLGLEPGPTRPSQPAAEQPVRPQPVERDLGDAATIEVPTVPVGELRKELARKRAKKEALSQVGKQHVGGLLDHHIAAPSRGGTRRLAFDRRHAVAAIIGMEVLGSPRALRAYQGPGEDR